MKGESVFITLGIVLILVLTGVLLFLVKGPSITGNAINNEEVVYIQEIPVNFTITDKRIIGINIDTDYIGLATIMRGHGARRYVNVVNPFNFPVEVELSFSENIRDLMGVDNNKFILEGNNDSLRINVDVNSNESTSLGNYSGVMIAVMKRI